MYDPRVHKPLLCVGKGAARHVLYFSGSSGEGRPAHWHRFSWPAILLKHTHTHKPGKTGWTITYTSQTERALLTDIWTQRGRGDWGDNWSGWENNQPYDKNTLYRPAQKWHSLWSREWYEFNTDAWGGLKPGVTMVEPCAFSLSITWDGPLLILEVSLLRNKKTGMCRSLFEYMFYSLKCKLVEVY